MQKPAGIVARDPAAETVREEIEARVAKLEEFFDRITGCRVTVDGPGGHRGRGRYHIGIEISVPRSVIALSHQSDEEIAIAMRDAFNAAERRLEDYVRRLRGDVKARHGSSHGTIVRLFPERDYGFLEADGREIYFHRHSVLPPGFDDLAVGSRVRFAEEEGEKGPQASTVCACGKAHR